MKTCIQQIDLIRPESQHTAALCILESNLEQLKSIARTFLHPTELAYFQTLKFERRQHSFLLGRYAAKRAIMKCCDIENPTLIEIKAGVFNHPVVKFPGNKNLQVSIAHSQSWTAAIAFPEEHPMGIDLESLTARSTDAIVEQLTPAEHQLAELLDLDQQTTQVLLWSAKEALGKTIKCGITIPLQMMELRSFTKSGEVYTFIFTHFVQYKAISYLLEGNAITIVLPRDTNFEAQPFRFTG